MQAYSVFTRRLGCSDTTGLMREEYIGEMRWRGQSAAHTRFDEDELFAETAEDDVLDTPPTDKLPRETVSHARGL